MIGLKLAHYEITSHLGSGGMGDVYQATDSKLGRSVAIKFLPEAFSHDSERVARFEREARVLASLNHSNIAAIFGLEESGDRKFLVMELVGGVPEGEGFSNSPTLSMAATNAGLILGTAAYMSPEQAKGRAVDKRTDIFAFGCVLYEMLTGRPAFYGEDVGKILARVSERARPHAARNPAPVATLSGEGSRPPIADGCRRADSN
jgi:serine/threonine protein kinase